MKRSIFFTYCLLVTLFSWGQVDADTLQPQAVNDTIQEMQPGFTASQTITNVTKAEKLLIIAIGSNGLLSIV